MGELKMSTIEIEQITVQIAPTDIDFLSDEEDDDQATNLDEE